MLWLTNKMCQGSLFTRAPLWLEIAMVTVFRQEDTCGASIFLGHWPCRLSSILPDHCQHWTCLVQSIPMFLWCQGRISHPPKSSESLPGKALVLLIQTYQHLKWKRYAPIEKHHLKSINWDLYADTGFRIDSLPTKKRFMAKSPLRPLEPQFLQHRGDQRGGERHPCRVAEIRKAPWHRKGHAKARGSRREARGSPEATDIDGFEAFKP